MDPYLSRSVRAARAAGVIGSWFIWASGLFVAFATDVPKIIVILIIAFGFAPYLLSLHVVEPWLIRRAPRDPTDD